MYLIYIFLIFRGKLILLIWSVTLVILWVIIYSILAYFDVVQRTCISNSYKACALINVTQLYLLILECEETYYSACVFLSFSVCLIWWAGTTFRLGKLNLNFKLLQTGMSGWYFTSHMFYLKLLTDQPLSLNQIRSQE